MSTTRASVAADTRHALASHYWTGSKQPLQIFVFLVPLVIAYEIGLAFVLRSSEGVITIKAHETLLDFFDTFGLTATGGLYLGGAVILVVLLVWHLLTRDPWRIDPTTPPLMAVESLLLALPLIVLGLIIAGGVTATSPGSPIGTTLNTMNIPTRLTIGIGAGLYEELLFRMMLIAVVHTLLVDAAKLPARRGAGIAILVSAVAFTLYHPLRDAAGGLSGGKIVFYFLAGLYFGTVYTVRGFGIVVATHAFYDIIVVSLLSDAG